MTLLRVFARPGWVALAIVVVGFAVACFVVLAPWQLGKNGRTEHRNNLIKSAVATAPVAIDSVYTGTAPIKSDIEWREVTLSGRYEPSKQSVVRLRSVDDSPAFEVLTPFRSDDGRTFIVDRGYVRPEQGAVLPSISLAPSDPTAVTARIRAPEGTTDGRGPRVEAATLQVYTIDPSALGSAQNMTVASPYLQLSPGQPGSLGELPIPQLDSGPYLSYGLQWIAFGVMAPLGLMYFVVAEVRHRRAAAKNAAGTEPDPADHTRRSRAKENRKLMAAASSSGFSDGRVKTGIGYGPQSSDNDAIRGKLTDRYGSR